MKGFGDNPNMESSGVWVGNNMSFLHIFFLKKNKTMSDGVHMLLDGYNLK